MKKHALILGIGILIAVAAVTNADCDPFQGTRYVCSRQGADSSFAVEKAPGCVVLPKEAGWLNISASPNAIVDVQPSSLVRESDGVKVWVRFYLSQSSHYMTQQGQDKGEYDGIKGVYKFLCKTHQQVLLQADYTMAGTPVYYRLSNEAITEEIEPGTISDTIFRKYC